MTPKKNGAGGGEGARVNIPCQVNISPTCMGRANPFHPQIVGRAAERDPDSKIRAFAGMLLCCECAAKLYGMGVWSKRAKQCEVCGAWGLDKLCFRHELEEAAASQKTTTPTKSEEDTRDKRLAQVRARIKNLEASLAGARRTLAEILAEGETEPSGESTKSLLEKVS